MFIGAILCAISLCLANFGVEAVFHSSPDYLSALEATYDQAIAIAIYYAIWVRPEVLNGNVR